jgi:hypothetical protein
MYIEKGNIDFVFGGGLQRASDITAKIYGRASRDLFKRMLHQLKRVIFIVYR